jgi:hypothetical protein
VLKLGDDVYQVLYSTAFSRKLHLHSASEFSAADYKARPFLEALMLPIPEGMNVMAWVTGLSMIFLV